TAAAALAAGGTVQGVQSAGHLRPAGAVRSEFRRLLVVELVVLGPYPPTEPGNSAAVRFAEVAEPEWAGAGGQGFARARPAAGQTTPEREEERFGPLPGGSS